MAGDIDLEPDYQRGVVWPKSKQSAIIESLLSHYYVPPILLSQKEDPETGEPKWTCIDGKQRLSSVKLFMNNEVRLRCPQPFGHIHLTLIPALLPTCQIPVRDANGRSFYYTSAGPGKRSLPPEVYKRFRKETIPAVIYEGLNDEQEREMFQRVQMGVTLSAAEKLSALRNKWTIFFDELTKKYMDADSTSGHSLTHIVSISRSQEWYLVAQSALVILHSREAYVPTYSALKTFMERDKKGPSERLQTEVKETMARYIRLANDSRWNKPLLPNKVGSMARKLSPVEFVMTSYMIWKYPTATFYELAEWTGILRKSIHEAVPSQVRMNGFCVRFLRDKIGTFRPAEPGDGPRPGFNQSRAAAAPEPSTSGGSSAAARNKRPANAVEDVDGGQPQKRRQSDNAGHRVDERSGGSSSVSNSTNGRQKSAAPSSSGSALFNTSPSPTPTPSHRDEPAEVKPLQQSLPPWATQTSLSAGGLPPTSRLTPRNPYA